MTSIRQKSIIKFKDDSFIKQLVKLLIEVGKVKVRGIGIFEVRKLKARDSYNVYDGSRIKIPARKKIAFRPAKILIDKIKNAKDL